MNLSELSGLEVLKKMIGGEIPGPPMTKVVPMELLEAEEGRVLFSATANDDHLNTLGAVHGGFAATVLDSAAGCVVSTKLGPGVGFATIDLTIKMIRPLPRNETLLCEGRLINLSKSLGISEASLSTKDGKLLATATSTCMIQSPEKSGKKRVSG